MDCEKFDQHIIDALYEELDELTHAAMKRHMESCNRCASAFSGLRATREVGIVPLDEPSDELEARILEAVAIAQKKTPLRRKALRALAWAGSHAMRPQLAMAALFVLVIGSSLLLLRAKPGTVGVAPVRVTERGVPAPDQPEVADESNSPPEPSALAAAPVAAAEAEQKRPEDVAKDKGQHDDVTANTDGQTALKEAQALQTKSGCAAALSKFDEIGAQYPGTAVAHTAMWEAARCYKSSGEDAKARELFSALRSVDSYKDRAEQELADADGNVYNAQNYGTGPAAAKVAAAPARPKAVAAPAPAPPAATEAQADQAVESQSKKSAPAGQGLAAPAKRSAAGY